MTLDCRVVTTNIGRSGLFGFRQSALCPPLLTQARSMSVGPRRPLDSNQRTWAAQRVGFNNERLRQYANCTTVRSLKKGQTELRDKLADVFCGGQSGVMHSFIPLFRSYDDTTMRLLAVHYFTCFGFCPGTVIPNP
jgi:hypothetical protein